MNQLRHDETWRDPFATNDRASPRRELTATEAATLIALMKEAEKPVLIHCQGGADRSGLASALYPAAVKESDEATAESQLSIRFGHFSLPFIAEYAMNHTFKALAPSVDFRGSTRTVQLD